MTSIKIALVAGLVLLAVAIGLTLSRSPMVVAASNDKVLADVEELGSTSQRATFCQAGETLPYGSSAIRFWLSAAAGPPVSLVAYSDRRPIASGKRGSDWIGSLTIPVKPLPTTVSGVTLCLSFSPRDESVLAEGNATRPEIAAHDGQEALAGRIWIEYLRPDRRSWASLAAEVIRHMGFGRAVAGDWIAYLALALFVTIAGVASSVVLRELR